MAEPHPDVVIVGAGIVGAACALALARERLRVLVLDSQFAGGGSTAAAMGHIVVMDDSEAQLALTARSRQLWSGMVSGLPPDCEDEGRGTLWLATSEADMQAAASRQASYGRHGVVASVIDARELSRLEPNLRPGLAGALHVPDDRVLYPPAVARHWLEHARALGATLREGCTAQELHARGVIVRDSAGSVATIAAGAVLVASGIDAPQLIPELPVIPRKGHLLITERYPSLCHSQLVELGYLHSAHTMSGASVAFNVQPRATGQLLIGSSRELTGREPGINHALLRDMLHRAIEFVPALAGCAAVRAWTGFRPATPDKLPLIGKWDAIDGVWVAVGHEGLGITMAPGTAEMIASLMLDRTPPVDPLPFSPTRVLAATPPGRAE